MTLDELQDRYRELLESDPAATGGRLPEPFREPVQKQGRKKRGGRIIDRVPRGEWFRAVDLERSMGVARSGIIRALRAEGVTHRHVQANGRRSIEWWVD